MKFYPADWRADPALRMCSLGARGLWIEMLAIMHEADPRGHLLINGKAVSTRHLSSLVGAIEEQVKEYLSELSEAGVYSAKRNGVLFSRRMERDEIRASKLRANGKLGGNPSLRKQTTIEVLDNQPDNTQKPEARSQIPEQETPAPPNGEASPKGERKKPDRGKRVDGFIPDISVAVELGMTPDQARFESEQFLDYWRGVPGAKGLKSDWVATWRNRVREQIKRNGTGGPQRGNGSNGYQGRPTHKQTADGISRAFANIAARRGEPFASFEDHPGPASAADDVRGREITIGRRDDGGFGDDPQRSLRVVGSRRY